MAKVTVNGEVFHWDASRKPMSEALAIENGLKCRFTDWENDLQAGSARAICGFIWLVWRRNGRDIPLEDILAGKVEIDLGELAVEADEGEDEAAAGPTSLPPEPSPTTGGNTSRRSASSGSARGRSAS